MAEVQFRELCPDCGEDTLVDREECCAHCPKYGRKHCTNCDWGDDAVEEPLEEWRQRIIKKLDDLGPLKPGI